MNTDPPLCPHLCVVERNGLRVCHQQRFLHPVKSLLLVLSLQVIQQGTQIQCILFISVAFYTP